MPYIHTADRLRLDATICFVEQEVESAGELNYVITNIVGKYANRQLNYNAINEVIGVLECAKLEMYRRLAAPYEDTKIAANGDVSVYQGEAS